MITKLRTLNPKSTDTKYTGMEPDWSAQPLENARRSALMKAFAWYNYHYDKKTAKQLVLDWMLQNDPKNRGETNVSQTRFMLLPSIR